MMRLVSATVAQGQTRTMRLAVWVFRPLGSAVPRRFAEGSDAHACASEVGELAGAGGRYRSDSGEPLCLHKGGLHHSGRADSGSAAFGKRDHCWCNLRTRDERAFSSSALWMDLTAASSLTSAGDHPPAFTPANSSSERSACA